MPQTNPVFILFAHTIGTPVRLSPERREVMRAWLNGNGWPLVAMVGDPGFPDPGQPPPDRIPMSGMMFELFDASRTGGRTDLRVFDLRGVVRRPRSMEPYILKQQAWCKRLLNEFSKNFALYAPQSKAAFRRVAGDVLRKAFDVGQLNPLEATLPGLDALSEQSPLLFGRSELIDSLTARALGTRADGADAAPCTMVLGVSGAGKSSLMRAGLMRQWFRERPDGPARVRDAYALLVEPALLQLDEHEDPLRSLGAMLVGSMHSRERGIGPLPGPLTGPAQLPDLPVASGDLETDLADALDWWERLTSTFKRPLVLVLDQAEQIEAIARRHARESAKADVEPQALPPAWLRFTALLAALSDQLDATLVSSALVERVFALSGRVRLVLGLHRLSALALWPLKPNLSKGNQVEVAPLRDEATLGQVIEGTCAAYGLKIDPVLLQTMSREAAETANRQQAVIAPQGIDQDAIPITHSAASVLPQMVTALQLMLSEWRKRAQCAAQIPESMLELDAATYGPLSGIAGSIERLGEMAWARWQATVAASSEVNLQGYFARQTLEEEQRRQFGRLMASLVDATAPA